MKKYVSSLLTTTCVLIVMVNVYLFSLVIMKTDEKEYSKIDNFAYVYSVTQSQNVEQAKTDEEVKTEEPVKDSTSTVTKESIKTETQVTSETSTTSNTNEKKTTDNQSVDITSYPALETFAGSITGYGPDCYGCTGSGNTSYGYNIKNTMYYQDKTYGQVRILAADRSIPFGTVFRISGLKVYDKPFLAIVLDRGSPKYITGYRMDLAFLTESDPIVDKIGETKNITYEELRYGF